MLRNILIALAATGALGLGMTTMTASADAARCHGYHHCYNKHYSYYRHHNNSSVSVRIGVYPGYYGYRYHYYPRHYYGYYAPGCGYRWTNVSRWNGAHTRHVVIRTRSWVCY